MNTKRNAKKHIIVGIVVLLMSAIPILCNMYLGKPALNISEMIENEDINDLSLTIYYLSPYTDMFMAITGVEDLCQRSEKIVISGSDLEEHIDVFGQIGKDALKPVLWKSWDMNSLRIYYVLESKKKGRLFDVAMWGARNDSMIVSGYEAKANNVFIEAIIPFLPEDKAETLENFLIYGFR